MGKEQLIERTKSVITKETLKKDFTSLGLTSGSQVIVHSSLKSLGWVVGAEVAVIQALMETLTEEGTIVMPAQTTYNSEPSYWQHPPVPEDWWPSIRYMMPAFLPEITPSLGMGKIAETFRTFPGVLRSNHPTSSFTAWGKHAKWITENHSLNYPFGEDSPLARLYDLNASTLFIGTDYTSCTAMHLSEYRSESTRKEYTQGAAMMENGERVWKEFIELEENSETFNDIGLAFENEHPIQTGRIGQTTAKLISIQPLIDFTTHYLDKEQK
ncbi:aminoglycoside 3-N-acetyltransferase [Bacillus ectoiniformans]|uniref:aminoglycoside N(3)-acetyltransferase n=1 Tax=Bacillus ectoiniformans TaxID=1494429 RepID=UPI00195D61A3|nr:AAC(3) family N-acetyltransferase [Bacillus ectoiniformans]MBM7649574.1 aminoglycoside 3-N-acetyltransferase [Bacillus ectoiniformans]